jgi:hypothetical protein
MGTRSSLIALATLAACQAAPLPAPQAPTPVPAPVPAVATPPVPKTMRERVVADFETAVKTSKDAYVALFDFAAVGEIEILLHRYDLYGRLPKLTDDVKAQFAAEDGTPYPAEREQKNVGNFYRFLAQRTVGTGGCTAREPRTRYGKLLATYDALPQGTMAYENYEALRTKATGYVAKGGVVGFTCSGGKGGLAVVWTERPNSRGYDLITIYND